MGTMVQALQLDEAAARATAFRRPPGGSPELRGHSVADAARGGHRDPLPVPGGWGRHHHDEHVRLQSGRDGGIPPVRRRRCARSTRRRSSVRDARSSDFDVARPIASLRRRFDRSHGQADGDFDPGGGCRAIAEPPSTRWPIRTTQQVAALVEAGVDILLPETVIDTLNLKACLFAIQQYFDETGRRVPGDGLGDVQRGRRDLRLESVGRGHVEFDFALSRCSASG